MDIPQPTFVLTSTGQEFEKPLWTRHFKGLMDFRKGTKLPDSTTVIDFEFTMMRGLYLRFKIGPNEWRCIIPWRNRLDELVYFEFDDTFELSGVHLSTFCDRVNVEITWEQIRNILHMAFILGHIKNAEKRV